VTLTGQQAQAQTAHPPANSRFSFDDVVKRATELASAPFEGKLPPLPDELNKLDFDAWRQIEFRDNKSLLGGNGSQFRLELFHLGHLYKRPVVINTLRDGLPTPIPYQASEFAFGSTKFTKPLPVNLGFAGFKIRSPLNDPKKFDEFISFVGSSYFRFLGRGQQYGLSARGLALAGGTNQEEFPFYREFWIEMPKPNLDKLTIYALLDSSVTTGAFQFDCYPQENSVVEIKATLIPRRDDVKVGYAPLTSMFFIGENDHRICDDFRPELHDSDGLMIHSGAGEWIWRPLRNPTIAKTSAFFDRDVQGFGLLQRDRDFSHYQDIDLAYQLRPSYWVTPKMKLGEGHVELFEMPTTDETNDNIVASWISKEPLVVGKPFSYAYSITSALDLKSLSRNGKVLATFQTSARALGSSEPNSPTTRRFMIDYNGGDLAYFGDDPGQVQIVAATSQGKILRSYTQFNPYIGGFRATLDIDLEPGQTADLRAYLKNGPNALSETWMFPWQAPGMLAPPPPVQTPQPTAAPSPAPPAPAK
jgi:glucans biosynthesis protein